MSMICYLKTEKITNPLGSSVTQANILILNSVLSNT